MNITKKLLAILFLAAISTSAFAAEKQGEISVTGSISTTSQDTGGSTTMTFVNLSYGAYITEQLVITVSDFIMISDSVGFNLLGLGAKYYLSAGKKGDFVPFGEAGLNLGFISTPLDILDTSGFYIGGGASYYMTETASADGRLTFSSQNVSGIYGSYSQTQTQFLVGLTQRF